MGSKIINNVKQDNDKLKKKTSEQTSKKNNKVELFQQSASSVKCRIRGRSQNKM